MFCRMNICSKQKKKKKKKYKKNFFNTYDYISKNHFLNFHLLYVSNCLFANVKISHLNQVFCISFKLTTQHQNFVPKNYEN